MSSSQILIPYDHTIFKNSLYWSKCRLWLTFVGGIFGVVPSAHKRQIITTKQHLYKWNTAFCKIWKKRNEKIALDLSSEISRKSFSNGKFLPKKEYFVFTFYSTSWSNFVSNFDSGLKISRSRMGTSFKTIHWEELVNH